MIYYTVTCQYVDDSKSKQATPLSLNWNGQAVTNVPPPSTSKRDWDRLQFAIRMLIRIYKLKEAEKPPPSK